MVKRGADMSVEESNSAPILRRWPSLLIGILVLGGFILFMLGMIVAGSCQSPIREAVGIASCRPKTSDSVEVSVWLQKD